MSKRSIILPAALAALLSSAVLGCAGGGATSAEDYETAVVEARDRVDLALSRLSEATSEEDFLIRLEEASEAVEGAAANFADVSPPTEFEDESDRLVRHFRELAASLQGTADQARQTGFESMLRGVTGLNFESWDKANAVLRALRQQGVDVEPLARH